MVKAATQASGDCVRLLESKTHGIHRLAPAADHSLQGETRRRTYIQMVLTPVNPQHRCTALQAERSLGAVPELRPPQAGSTGLTLTMADKEATESTKLYWPEGYSDESLCLDRRQERRGGSSQVAHRHLTTLSLKKG